MLHQLYDICSVRWLDLKTVLEEVQQFLRYVFRVVGDAICICDLHQQAHLAFFHMPRWISCYQLKHCTSETPDVMEAVYHIVVTFLQQLRRCPVVILCVDASLFVQLWVNAAKISQLASVVCPHVDVCRLEVSMRHIKVMKVFKALDDLFGKEGHSILIIGVGLTHAHIFERWRWHKLLNYLNAIW